MNVEIRCDSRQMKSNLVVHDIIEELPTIMLNI